MAHRCHCRWVHFDDSEEIRYPRPEKLVALDPHILDLIHAAREFDSFGSGNAVDFVQWLATDTKRAVERLDASRGAVAP